MADATKKPRSYRDLIVWQKSMELVKSSYRLAEMLPRRELFGLSAQIRRAQFQFPQILQKALAAGIPRNMFIICESQMVR